MVPTRSKVLVCSTAKPSERIKTLAITPRAGADRRIAMRLGPDEAGYSPLPDLLPGDELKLLIELEVTTDCFKPEQGDCVRQPYRYSPRVRARVLLADNPTARKTGRSELVHNETAIVTQAEHHHVFVFEPHLVVPGNWKARTSYVIVTLDAHYRNANPNQVLLVGANEKGRVEQDKGRINVVRLRPGDDPWPAADMTRTLRTRSLPLTKEKRVVCSLPLERLRKDEQLAIGALVEGSAKALPYKARISTRLVLADSPSETDTGRAARKLDPAFKGEISEHNGTNVMPRETKRMPTVGVLRVARNAAQRHHVNLVCEGADPVLDRTDKAVSLVRGSLAVTRYLPEWKG